MTKQLPTLTLWRNQNSMNNTLQIMPTYNIIICNTLYRRLSSCFYQCNDHLCSFYHRIMGDKAFLVTCKFQLYVLLLSTSQKILQRDGKPLHFIWSITMNKKIIKCLTPLQLPTLIMKLAILGVSVSVQRRYSLDQHCNARNWLWYFSFTLLCTDL